MSRLTTLRDSNEAEKRQLQLAAENLQLQTKRGRLTTLCDNNEAEKRQYQLAEENPNSKTKVANNISRSVFA